MKRKMIKGFTLIELMIVVAIIGILAAIAIPNFIRFQARSKQSEVKSNLKALFTAERSYHQEKDTYTGCIKKMGFNPERGNRYRYDLSNVTPFTDEACGATVEARATAAGVSTTTDGAVAVDTFKHDKPTMAAAVGDSAVVYAPVAPAGSGIAVSANLRGVFSTAGTQDINSSFGMGSAGNIDSDTAFDVWYISSVSSTTAGICPVLAGNDQNVPGGEPKNTYNDVNCP